MRVQGIGAMQFVHTHPHTLCSDDDDSISKYPQFPISLPLSGAQLLKDSATVSVSCFRFRFHEFKSGTRVKSRQLRIGSTYRLHNLTRSVVVHILTSDTEKEATVIPRATPFRTGLFRVSRFCKLLKFFESIGSLL